jgi:CheY-like chemotaxis protein
MLRALVVEPDAPTGEALRDALVGRYDVRVVENGAQALDEVEHGAPGVLVADLDLPDVTTLELLTTMRHRTRRDPAAVFVSRRPRRVLRAGTWGPIVVPPLSRTSVLACVEEALLESELSRLRRIRGAQLANR